MVRALELKRVLMRYKKALRPRTIDLEHVTPDDLITNLRLLDAAPLQNNLTNKTRLRRQIGRRMTNLNMGSILCLRKEELITLYQRLLRWARAMGGPPPDPTDVRHLPTDLLDDDDVAPAMGLGF